MAYGYCNVFTKSINPTVEQIVLRKANMKLLDYHLVSECVQRRVHIICRPASTMESVWGADTNFLVRIRKP